MCFSVWMCLHQGCFAAEGRKRSQHCKCPRRHIRIATTIKIHELSMESLQSHFKIKIAQLRDSGHYCPSPGRRGAVSVCARRRLSSARSVPQPPESCRHDERKHVVTLGPAEIVSSRTWIQFIGTASQQSSILVILYEIQLVFNNLEDKVCIILVWLVKGRSAVCSIRGMCSQFYSIALLH